MITDNLITLSGITTSGVTVGQDLSQVVGTYNSESIVDLGTARDIGEGEPLYIVFTVTEAFVGATATVAMNCVVSAAAALTTPTTVGSIPATAVASLTLGAQFVVRINPLVASLGLRYLGVIYSIATATTTAGTMTAHVVTNFQDGKKFYASGFTA
jgi:hypothetical protein